MPFVAMPDKPSIINNRRLGLFSPNYRYYRCQHFEFDIATNKPVSQCRKRGSVCYLPMTPTRKRNGRILANSYYCNKHKFDVGFCVICSEFWGGVESFDFGSHRGICENCIDAIDDFDENEADDYDEYYYGGYGNVL